MNKTITKEVTLEIIGCPNCGTQFGVQQNLLNSLRENHSSFFCPNGHSMSYGETKREKELATLKKQLAQVKEDATFWEGRAERNAAAEKAARTLLKTTRANLTRTRNKLARGTCPACEQPFPDLAEHMSQQHPEYAAASETEATETSEVKAV